MPTLLNVMIVFEHFPTSIGHKIPTLVTSSQQKPSLLVRDLRKGKGIIDELITMVEGVHLFRGMSSERLDHYMDYLHFIMHETQIDAMS